MTAKAIKRVEQLLKYDSVAKLIFTHPFSVRKEERDTIDPNEASIFGMVTTGDRRMDELIGNSLVTVAIPIDEIAQDLVDGIEIAISHWEDIPVIYELATRYLNSWKHLADNQLHNTYSRYIDSETEQKLRNIAELAAELHQDAVIQLRKENRDANVQFGEETYGGWVRSSRRRSIARAGWEDPTNPTPKPVEDFMDVNALLRNVAKMKQTL